MMVAGADYIGDRFLFMGPNTLSFPVPNGRIRLNAFGKQVYLGAVRSAMVDAGVALEADLAAGVLKPIGEPPKGSRGADAFSMGFVEVIISCPPPKR